MFKIVQRCKANESTINEVDKLRSELEDYKRKYSSIKREIIESVTPQRFTIGTPIELNDGSTVIPTGTHLEYGCDTGPFDIRLFRFYSFKVLGCDINRSEEFLMKNLKQ